MNAKDQPPTIQDDPVSATDNGDGGITLSIESSGTSATALLSPLQAADLSLKLLEWVAKTTGETADLTVQRRPLVPHSVVLQDAVDELGFILAVDLGAARLRIAMSLEHIAEVLAPLTFADDDPPTTH